MKKMLDKSQLTLLNANPNNLPFHIGTPVACISTDIEKDETWRVAPVYQEYEDSHLPEGYTFHGWRDVTSIEKQSNNTIIVTIAHIFKCKYDKQIWDSIAKHVPKEV